MLRCYGIKKSFSNHEILKGISFDAQAGKLTALLGKNGAGKSSLFNIIAGTLDADLGRITLGEYELDRMQASERAQHIALLKQDPKTSTASSLSVFDNFALAMLKTKKARLKSALSPQTKDIIISHIKDLGLDESLLTREMGSLSGGQRQILAFAMATLHRPSLLLLDEPTAALDEEATNLLMKLVKRFINEWQIPAVMICHDKELVEQFADDTYVLLHGIIAAPPS